MKNFLIPARFCLISDISAVNSKFKSKNSKVKSAILCFFPLRTTRYTKGLLVLFGAFLIFNFSFLIGFAQCKGFVKKQIPKLAPFIHNGQINSSILLSGDHAELTLTFYSGQTYRIMVNAQEALGNIYFVMKDAKQKQLFNSKEQGKVDYWDFTVESTQQLTVEVIVPDAESPTGMVPSGCVSILVGFKQ